MIKVVDRRPYKGVFILHGAGRPFIGAAMLTSRDQTCKLPSW